MSLKPDALPEVVRNSVRLIGVAVDRENFHRAVTIIVVPFVSREREVREIRVVPAQIDTQNTAVMISNNRKEAVGRRPRAVNPAVRINVIMIELAYVGIDGRGQAARIIIISDGHDEIGIPTLHKISDREFVGAPRSIIADHSNHDRFSSTNTLDRNAGGGYQGELLKSRKKHNGLAASG